MCIRDRPRHNAIPTPTPTDESDASALTANNLAQLQDEFVAAGAYTIPSTGPPSDTSDSSSSSSARAADAAWNAEMDRLRRARIFVERRTPLPAPVEDLITRLRDTEREASPKAAEAVEKAFVARDGNEEHSKRILGEFLALAGHSEGGHHWTAYHTNARLSEQFLPNEPTVPESQRIKRAEPDICLSLIHI